MVNELAGVTLDDFPNRTDWDCIIIGAGPTGSSAAIQLARKGYRVLLIDKKRFPRTKVCGGCLSGKAVAAIKQLELTQVLDGAIPLDKFVLAAGGRQVSLHSHGGVGISRNQLDMRLIDQALQAGVTFLPESRATLGELKANARTVNVTRQGKQDYLNAQVVLVCTGLANPDQQQTVPLVQRIDEHSRIGLTTIVESNCPIERGTILMSVDASGYLGIARLEDGRVNLSACVRQSAVSGDGSPAEYAASHLRAMGWQSIPEIFDSQWMGTPKLTRQLKIPAGRRVFALGDAAKYLEPFTGEGIGWAIESAMALRPIVECAIDGWDDSFISLWDRRLSRLLKRRQRTCYAMKFFAGRSKLVGMTIPVLKRLPSLSKPVMNAIHGTQQ